MIERTTSKKKRCLLLHHHRLRQLINEDNSERNLLWKRLPTSNERNKTDADLFVHHPVNVNDLFIPDPVRYGPLCMVCIIKKRKITQQIK